MNLSLCPLLTLKSPMGPGGCGKWEARSLLNSCVIEFPHNTANVCTDAGTSVPRAIRVKQGPKIPRARFGLAAVTYMDKSARESQEKMNSPHLSGAGNLPTDGKNIQPAPNTTILMSQRSGHITSTTNWPALGLSHCHFSRFFPLVAVHICLPCARPPGSHACSTPGAGPEPKTRIYEATSALALRQTQEYAKAVWCWLHVVGIRRRGEVGEAQTARERVSVLAPTTEQ